MNGSKIIDLIAERGVSIRKVSREANVSPVTIYKLIRGENVSTATIEKLCLYFDVGVGDLVESGRGYKLKHKKYVVYPEAIIKMQQLLDEIEKYTRGLSEDMDKIRNILADNEQRLSSCTNDSQERENKELKRLEGLIDNVRQDINSCVLREEENLK